MFTIDRDKIFWREVEGETVILNIDSGFYYTLDEIGTLIWEMILANKEPDQITTEIIDEYNVTHKTAEKDIRVLLKNLEKEKLIENK